MQRRELLIGAGCVAAALGASALTPHRQVSLLGHRSLKDIVPSRFGAWTSTDVSDLSAPFDRQGLVDKLYDEVVQRIYIGDPSGPQFMVLLAHGAVESDQLQLHRPEVCYPAFGYALSQTTEDELPIAGAVRLPVRRFTASSSDRQENVVYWTRLGEAFPTNGTQQRLALLESSMRGDIVDGLLVRFSTFGSDTALAMSLINAFVPLLVRAVPANLRAPLVGTTRSAALRAAGF